MSCNSPLLAYYANAINPETGKRSLVFSQFGRYTGGDVRYVDPLEVPCGKCLGCQADQSLMWAIRAYHESIMHKESCFITLTYDQEHMPPDGKIDKKELQRFFKRLRRHFERVDDRMIDSLGASWLVSPLRKSRKFRYVACGEYGDQTRRAHYHLIFFGRDFLEGAMPINSELYTHPDLEKVWGKGIVSIAPVSMASICYVCGYVQKKVGDPDTFRLESRRPGIGHDWLDRYGDSARRTGVVSIEGRSYQIPKRYLQWDEDMFAEVKKARTEFAKEQAKLVPSDVRFYKQRGREINLKGKNASRKESI